MSRRRKKKKTAIKVIIPLVLIAVLAAAGIGLYISDAGKPYDQTAIETVINVVIPSGTGTSQIAAILEENQIIKSSSSFKLLAKFKGYDGKFKAGEYSLSPAMSPIEIMDSLTSGNVNTMRFTVPEGLTLVQTAEKLAGDNLINLDTFMKEVESGEFTQKFIEFLPKGENRLEGFLFPETYDVYTTATEHDIINRMLNQFDAVYKDEYYTRASELGYDINQIITIASMIERETMISDEMPIVASVIYNRLAIGMKLQIDATVQYALGEHKDRLSYKDTEVESPYNTYANTGLPPGPICSPGAKAIEAALYPADTDYIYYVLSKAKDGTHNFTQTYNEFLKYKNEYLNSL